MTRFPVATRRGLLGAGLAMPGLALLAEAAAKPPEPPPAPSEPPASPEPPLIDQLKAMGRFLGTWRGNGSDRLGFSTVERTYSSVLDGRFVLVRNTMTYPPQSANESGEAHSDLGLYSFDTTRQLPVLRQFFSEGVVHQYAMEDNDLTADRLEFESEAIEGVPPGYKARKTYVFLGPDALQDVLEMAAPGKEYEVYTDSRLLRA